MLNRRVHILLDKDRWNKIIKYSKAEKISAAEYIRRAVDEFVTNKIEDTNKNRATAFKGFFKSKAKQSA